MQLRTLGGPELLGADFRRPKSLLLLAYLAVEGPRDRRFLAELFWPRATNRLNSLAQALSQIRRELPGAAEVRDTKIHLLLPCDIDDLLAAIDRRDVPRALELYRAPFLEHFHLPAAGVELEEWIFRTREFLAGRLRGLLIAQALERVAAARIAEAVALAEAACAVSAAAPLEPHLIELLHPLLVVGDSPLAAKLRSEAADYDLPLAAGIEEARSRLGSHLGRTLPGRNLPLRDTSFVGRERETAELVSLLERSDRRLVTLLGPGGTGKTRLALQVAQRLPTERFEFVAFVALESLDDSDAIGGRIAAALGIELHGDDPLAEVQDFLGGREALLLLDNFEHLLDGAPILSRLLAACPGISCLVTSRSRLQLDSEWLFTLSGLPFPSDSEVGIERGRECAAVKLFLDRGVQVRRDFALGDDNWPSVAALCALVEGSPLALEIAAGWLRILSPRDIVAEIRRTVDFLRSDLRDLPPRQRSIRATFEHSWNLLDEREQAVLRRVSVFAGGFTHLSACEVAGADLAVLASLVDKALIRPLPDGRFGIHTLIARFALEKLAAAPDEQRDIRGRHARSFAAWAEKARSGLGSEQALWLRRFGQEHDNLRAALTWAVSSADTEIALRLAVAAGPYWRRCALFREGRGWLGRVLALPGVADLPLLHAGALGAAGDMARRLDSYAAARSLYEQGLAIYRQQRDDLGVAGSLMVIGILAAECGDYHTSRAHFEQSLALERRLERPQGISVALGNLATIAELQGDYRAARTLNEQSLAIKRDRGDESGVAVSLGNLGLIATYQGDYPAARSYLERCLEIETRLGTHAGRVLTLNYLGAVGQRLGDYSGALPLHRQGLALAREIGDKAGAAESLHHLGVIAAEQGDHRSARERLENSLALGRELGNRLGIATALGSLGLLALYRGDSDRSLSLQRQSLELERDLGNRAGIARALQRLGRAALECGDIAAAGSQLDESLDLRRALGDRHEIAGSLAEMGLIEQELRRIDSARRCFLEALAMWHDLGFLHGQALLLRRFAELNSAQEQFLRAAHLWGAAEALSERLGVPVQPFERDRYQSATTAARTAVDQERFSRAWRQGRAASEASTGDILAAAAEDFD